ncbi:MAG: hypothetical protein U1E98_04690 [Moraxella osloensis]
MKLSHLIVGMALAAVGVQANAVNITELLLPGATFPQPVYSKWAGAYQKATGSKSATKVSVLRAVSNKSSKNVDFGATDAPMNGMRAKCQRLNPIPAVIGGVASG